MTIASEIQRIKTNIASAYTSCNNKGATMPATQNSANLATTINSISGGSATLITKNITQNGTYNASSDNADGYSSVSVNVSGTTPTGTLSITANGTYDVTNYASADVSVSGGGGGSVSAPIFEANYFVSTNGSITNLMTFRANTGSSYSYILKPFAKGLANSATVHNWLDSNLNEVDTSFTSIKTIDQIAEFSAGQFGLLDLAFGTTTEFISFRALEEAMFTNAKAFQLLTSLKKVDLHNAKKVALTAAFSGLSNFQEIDLTSVEDLTAARALGGTAGTGGAFANTSVSTLSFPSLKSTSFGSYTNQFAYMLKGVTGCIVHFPSNLQSVIGSWSDVTSGFGGTNTTILFDLPATT